MRITIIIPTRNRDWLLQKTLASLVSQNFPKDELEVLVCDHDSSDGTEQVCKSLVGTLDLRLIHVPFERFCVQQPKNVGILRARYELSVVIDCGIICPPGFLRSHHDMHLRAGNSYVSGPTYGWDAEQEDDFWRSLEPPYDLPQDLIPAGLIDCRTRMAAYMKHASWLLFWGCNFSVRTSDLRRVGGFDESFVGWGWDDLDLGIRLQKLGLNFKFEPSTWCFHYPHARQTLIKRLEEGTQNWIRTYNKQPAPELELWEASDYADYDRNLVFITEILSKNESNIPALDLTGTGEGTIRTEKTLYWGFKAAIGQSTNSWPVALIDSRWPLKLIPSFGLRTPFPAGEFETVVISPYWQFLTFQLSPLRPRLLNLILREALRVGGRLALINLRQVDEAAVKVLMNEISLLKAQGRGEDRINIEA